MTDKKLIDITEMEPRSFKPQASNPIPIKEMVITVPDVSIFMGNELPEKLRASPCILNDKIPKIGQQFNKPANTSRRNQTLNSPKNSVNSVLPITHVNTQQQQQQHYYQHQFFQVPNTSDRIQHMKIINPYKSGLMSQNENIHHQQQQISQASNTNNKIECMRTTSSYKPDLINQNGNIHHQQIRQVSNPINRMQHVRTINSYKTDLMNQNGNTHYQQQIYPVPYISDKAQHVRTISPHKFDVMNQNRNTHYQQQQQICQIPNTNDEIKRMRAISNNLELINDNYSPDMRLRFYQRLQDLPKVLPSNSLKPKQDGRPLPPLKSQFSPPKLNPIGDVTQVSQLPLAVNNTPPPRSKSNESKNDKININKENIWQLEDLIKNQASYIQALKMQVISLIALNKEKLKTQKLLSTVRCNQMNVNPKVIMTQNQQFTQTNQNTNYAMMENKISVGVMTSFEFTLKNKQIENNTNEVNQQQQMQSPHENQNCLLPANLSHPKRNDEIETQIDNPDELVNQNNFFNPSEMQAKEQMTRRINLEQNAAVSSFNIQDKYYLAEENNEMFQSTIQPKIGWTFYNNILCQVNEILNNSHDIRQPTQHLYNTIMQQRSTARQLKIFETKITDLKDIVSANISQKITATVDSSYYPKVNYQSNPIPSAESMTDSNTSFHMRKLAMKYLGNKNFSESMIMNEQLISRVLIDNDRVHNNNLSPKRALNYADKHILTSDQNHFVNIEGRRNYNQNNILDISVLKQQPKLL